MARENQYQASLIKRIKHRFPECFVLKNDANYIQGVPDLTVLFRDMWAALEVKATPTSVLQPNQQHYVSLLHTLSFAAVIHPGNEKEVLDAMEEAFASRGTARVP